MPRLLCAAALFALAAGLCPARADADEVKEKLFQAKKSYDAEVLKFKKAVGDLIDRREDDARKAGDKKAVDQAKAERKAFEDGGELPAALPAAAKQQIAAARADLDRAYTAAIKAYLLLKEDSAAAAAEKEQQAFGLSAALLFGKRTYLVTVKHNDLKDAKSWFTDTGALAGAGGAKVKRDGRLVPHSIHTYPPNSGTAEVRYQLAGRWVAFRTSVGVPKIEANTGDPASPLTFEVLGDGKSLWKSEPVTKIEAFQTCELNVSKVKVLTLLVHCPQENHWARAFWFEPVLIE